MKTEFFNGVFHYKINKKVVEENRKKLEYQQKLSEAIKNQFKVKGIKSTVNVECDETYMIRYHVDDEIEEVHKELQFAIYWFKQENK